MYSLLDVIIKEMMMMMNKEEKKMFQMNDLNKSYV